MILHSAVSQAAQNNTSACPHFQIIRRQLPIPLCMLRWKIQTNPILIEGTGVKNLVNNREGQQNRRCAREIPGSDKYIKQEEDFVHTNCFKDTQENLTREPDRKTARQLEDNVGVIDLTREMGSPFPNNVVPGLNTNSKSNRFFKGDNNLLKGTKSNQMREANWKAGKSLTWQKTLNLRLETEWLNWTKTANQIRFLSEKVNLGENARNRARRDKQVIQLAKRTGPRTL